MGVEELIRSAGASTVWSLFESHARLAPERIALADGERALSYGALRERALRWCALLARHGVARGERVAMLSENRIEYLELMLAAARMGAIVACQNWRLTPAELDHCIALVEPKLVLASARHAPALDGLDFGAAPRLVLGEALEAELPRAGAAPLAAAVDPEDILLILYTSGTTGLPKGAMISHRAEIARNLVIRADFGVRADNAFVAWSPLFHMGSADTSLGTLMSGGKVAVVDGFDPARLVELAATEEIGWLILMPGTIDRFVAEMKARGARPRGVRLCGVMADLVPPAQIAEVTALLDAPYANTFGSTETGCPPASSNRLPVGVAPKRLSKDLSPFCEVKLVDAGDNEVGLETPGELAFRGPTLFSGYWRAEAANAEDFRGGWFHMGDVFVRHADGSVDFVDRVKYLIKSGGENIYPAEIERALLAEPGVAEACVVRARDDKWGEVPVAFVAREDEALEARALMERAGARLARYKRPKEIRFVALADFPRNASGKILRHEVEKWL